MEAAYSSPTFANHPQDRSAPLTANSESVDFQEVRQLRCSFDALMTAVKRMRMLLRNVKTTLEPIHLSDAATSACLYV